MKRLNKFLINNPDAQKSFDKRAKGSSVDVVNWAVFIIAGICMLSLLLYPERAFGAEKEWKTGVRAVMSGQQYGSCMALLNYMPPDLVCPRGIQSGAWVSLDCDGEYNSVASAREALDLANVAMITGLDVSVRVDDRDKVGYCVASQVILWRE